MIGAMLMSERLAAWEAELDMVRDRMGRLASEVPAGVREQLLESLRSQLGAVVRDVRQAGLDAMRREVLESPRVRAAVRELAPTTFAAEARAR